MVPNILLRCVRNALPHPKILKRSAAASPNHIENVIVFGRHPNPTTDYYFTARFSEKAHYGYQLADIRDQQFEHLEPDRALVIICRYASGPVLKWIEKHRGRLSKVVLFIDDDIPSVIIGRDATLAYRIFLYYRALHPLKKLSRHLDAVWVSTRRLGESLGGVGYEVVPPIPPTKFFDITASETTTNDAVLIAYHATGIHYSEHKFLQPIITEVLKKRPASQFEVFAHRRAAKFWSKIPNVKVRKPIAWADYLAEALERRIDIMLVPLCQSQVNTCRSPSKRIDVARFAAAGIFSASEAYGITQGEVGDILPNDPDLWITQIIKLIDSADLRRENAERNLERVRSMADNADDILLII